jgi:hypothetical protein
MTALIQAERGESRYNRWSPTSYDAGFTRDITLTRLCDEILADGLGEGEMFQGERFRESGSLGWRVIKGTVQFGRSTSLAGVFADGLTA